MAFPTCPGCNAMAAEVLVPAETFGREGAPIGYCWICAHLVTEHEAQLTPENFGEHFDRCNCPREQVYPEKTFAPGQGQRGVQEGPSYDEEDLAYQTWARAHYAELPPPEERLAPQVVEHDARDVIELARELEKARADLARAERERDEALAPRSVRVSARERQAQAKRAAALTAASRRSAER